ncbi:hypothetical protein Rhopal_001738-T1 [Rhodotorula paludigena]|uniref:Mediator complex subunit 5 n=1 Tax=Rhodotorula paludigena TaxID=86838 RepID=A0AAV5GFX5_9BASI|nr:hypothetical protein Rhopal_001738-T1 [Rhodotorula paludigena]
MSSAALAELASLLQHRDIAPEAAQAAQIRLVVQQRILALLQLERTTRQLGHAQRDQLGPLVEQLKRAVEDEQAHEAAHAAQEGSRWSRAAKGKGASVKLAREHAEQALAQQYAAVMESFDADWAAGTALSDRWEVLLPAEGDTLHSWLDEVPAPGAHETARDFFTALLANPFVLGSGISTLDNVAALLPTAPIASSPSPDHPPLHALLHAVHAALGPSSVLELVSGSFETAIRELVGREQSARRASTRSASSSAGIGLGLGLGLHLGVEEAAHGETGGETTAEASRTARSGREKELEEFLVATLDALDGLGASVQLDGDPNAAVSPGPLPQNQRALEDTLLAFMTCAASLRPLGAATPDSRDTPPPPYSPPPDAGSSWSSSFASGFSTFASYPTAAISTVAGAAVNALPFSLPSPPASQLTTASPALDQRANRQAASSPLPSTPSPPIISAFLSYSPDSAFKPPARASVSPFSALLKRTAANLLRLLTPSNAPRLTSLSEALIARLLGSSFPLATAKAEHRKVLLLALVRWYGFGLLGRTLRHPTTASLCTPRSSTVRVPCAKGEVAFGADDANDGPPLLDEVYVSSTVELEYLVPLHREMYCAIVDVCGAGAAGEAGQDECESEEQRALQQAAQAFVDAWATPHEVRNTPRRTISTCAVTLTPADFAAIVTAFGTIVLPSSQQRFGLDSVAVESRRSPSFKRSTAFGASDGSSTVQDGYGEPEQDDLLSRAEQLAAHAAGITSTGEGAIGGFAAILYVTSSVDQPTSVSLVPPSPPPTIPANPPQIPLSDRQQQTVQQAVRTLIERYGQSFDRLDLVESLRVACEVALAARDHPLHLLFSSAASILSSVSNSTTLLIESLAAPLRQARDEAIQSVALSHAQLASLARQDALLRRHARQALSRLNALRMRGWHLSLSAAPLGVQLRTRLRAVHDPARPVEELERAQGEVDEWKAELGVVDALKLGGRLSGDGAGAEEAQLDEALMVVETAAAVAADSAAVLAHPLFEREKRSIGSPGGPDRAGRVARSASAANAALKEAIHGVPGSPPDLVRNLVLTEDGAAPYSLATATYGSNNFFDSLPVSLAAYFFAELSTPASQSSAEPPLIRLNRYDGRRIGSDSWIDEVARSTPSTLPGVPAPYAESVTDLLTRLVAHPSPSKKADALLDLEHVLSAVCTSAVDSPVEFKAAANVADVKASLRKRVQSSSARPTSVHGVFAPTALVNSAPQTTAAAEPSAVMTSTTSGVASPAASEASFGSIAWRRRRRKSMPEILPTSGDEPRAHAAMSTDDLLAQLESALVRFLPSLPPASHGLFLSLQLISSLLPSLLSSPSSRAKAVSDTLVAALSLKHDALDGKGGLVELAWEAMSDGTEEGEGLARQLCAIALREDSPAARDLAAALN